jgi:hypothetical protein|tara:strand:+ start:2283 stop:2618 length:336 start_codon:yes stop_codon:yes gene_type:complete
MTLKVNKEMRERIDAMKINIREEGYIYESPDHGKTIYKRPIRESLEDMRGPRNDDSVDYLNDDVSGVRVPQNNYHEVTNITEKIFDTITDIENELKELRNKFLELEKRALK